MADEAPNRMAETLSRLPWYTVPAILIGIPALFAILAKISDTFYREIVWKYYWGPIKADAYPFGDQLCSTGNAPVLGSCAPGHIIAEAGYNWVNTASWAVLLALCILGIAQMLHRFQTQADNKIILGATAWVVAGSVFHALQDANLFLQPLEFFFITPPIYLLFGAGGILSFLYAQYARYVVKQTGSVEAGLQKIWFAFAAIVLTYTLLWVQQWDQIVYYLNPIWIALFALLTFAVVRWRVNVRGEIDASEMVMVFSIGWILASILYVVSYVKNPWPGEIPSTDLWWAFLAAPALAAAVAGIVYLIARQLKAKGSENAFAFMLPMNLVLIFGQMVDAFATAIGIDLALYSEKHILSEMVRKGAENLWGAVGWTWGEQHPTFTGFATVKLLVSLGVVYAIDVQSKDDVKRYPTMIGLVKFAIIMVGIGPGIRNMTRMSLGI